MKLFRPIPVAVNKMLINVQDKEIILKRNEFMQERQ